VRGTLTHPAKGALPPLHTPDCASFRVRRLLYERAGGVRGSPARTGQRGRCPPCTPRSRLANRPASRSCLRLFLGRARGLPLRNRERTKEGRSPTGYDSPPGRHDVGPSLRMSIRFPAPNYTYSYGVTSPAPLACAAPQLIVRSTMSSPLPLRVCCTPRGVSISAILSVRSTYDCWLLELLG
jgi:hypothetical protein